MPYSLFATKKDISSTKMSGESDIEMHSALPKRKAKNPPKSPTREVLQQSNDTKKPSTKEMINQALSEMRSRKGISLYAIKKYIVEKYHVDVEKFNYLIKKSLKDGVEGGSIVQTKGMGASGSFRLAAKAKLEKKNDLETKKKSKPPKPASTSDKVTKQKTTGKTEPKEKKSDKNMENTKMGKSEMEKSKMEKTKEKITKKKSDESQAKKKDKPKKMNKIAKGLQTPSKAAMMKRKSIGSIIKTPKMKPKARS